MTNSSSLDMAGIDLVVPSGSGPPGTQVLAGLVAMAEAAVERLRETSRRSKHSATAVLSRLRGTGRGVSFTKLVGELERAHPLSLDYPFEGSNRVGGAVWIAHKILGNASTTSVAKLCWDSRATDLPMHVHDHSDRFIIVLKGRGFFHVSDESAETFTGQSVRSVPARERDVFLFTRGTVHTFSTDAEPMTLLSCQLPFLDFNDPRQYRLPQVRWTAKERPESYRAGIACDPGWSVLAERPAVPSTPTPTSRPSPTLAEVLTLGP